MLVKEFIGKLNSFNMDAEVEFEGGDDFAVDLVENENGKITDEGNAKKVIFKIVTKPAETATEAVESNDQAISDENANE
jgi:hypothetical protein